MVLTKASPDGASVAPAIPSSARAAISIPGFTTNAASIELAANATPPESSTRRCPTRSPSVPIVTRNPAIMNP